MSFLAEYKRLDNLCKDLLGSDAGVTSYLEEMDACGPRGLAVPDWKADYNTLKRYRHLRNQIAHESWAEESELCSADDEKWLSSFHDRILKRRDPLSLFRQLSQAPRTQPASRQKSPPQPPKRNSSVLSFLILFGVLLLLLVFFIVKARIAP